MPLICIFTKHKNINILWPSFRNKQSIGDLDPTVLDRRSNRRTHLDSLSSFTYSRQVGIYPPLGKNPVCTRLPSRIFSKWIICLSFLSAKMDGWLCRPNQKPSLNYYLQAFCHASLTRTDQSRGFLVIMCIHIMLWLTTLYRTVH